MEKNFLIIAIIMMIILIIKLLRFKKELDDKNIKLIQFYLDKKFINKSIANIIESKCWNQFHSDLIENIKEYFQFDDVVCLKIFDIENYENNNYISNLPSSIEQGCIKSANATLMIYNQINYQIVWSRACGNI